MNKGFTLVEVLAVIIVLILIMTVVYPSILPFIIKSEDKSKENDRKIFDNSVVLIVDNCYNLGVQTDGYVFSDTVTNIENHCNADLNLVEPIEEHTLVGLDVVEITKNGNDYVVVINP